MPVDGGPPAANDPSPIEATWQRCNDYGIGLFLEGATKGGQKGELKQAEEIFTKVAELGRADGWVNLARVYQREGRIPDALAALEKAANHKEPAAPWVINWLTGQINASNGLLDDAIASFESVLATKIPDRKFDFSLDYRVINDLGAALYARARIELPVTSPARRDYLQKAIAAYRRTLAIDSEDVSAHWGLAQAYSDPAWGEQDSRCSCPPTTRKRTAARRPSRPTPTQLVKLATSIADPKVAAAERRSRALRLARDIDAVHGRPAAALPVATGTAARRRRDPRSRLGRGGDRPGNSGRAGTRPEGNAPAVARTAQARRDRRGPGIFAWRASKTPRPTSTPSRS